MADPNEELLNDPASQETPPESTGSDDEGYRTVAGGELEAQAQESSEAQQVSEEQAAAEKAAQEAQPQESDGASFWRREYQELLRAAKADQPEFVASWLQQRKQERRQGTSSEPAPKTGPEPSLDEEEYVTGKHLKQVLNEIKNMFSEYQEQSQQQLMARQYQEEYSRVNSALVEFRRKHNISDAEHEQLSQEVLGFGMNIEAPGGPTAFLRAYGKLAMIHLQERAGRKTALQAQAEAEQKALGAKMAAQPASAPAGMQPKRDMTKEEKLLQQMKSVGSSDAEEEIFG